MFEGSGGQVCDCERYTVGNLSRALVELEHFQKVWNPGPKNGSMSLNRFSPVIAKETDVGECVFRYFLKEYHRRVKLSFSFARLSLRSLDSNLNIDKEFGGAPPTSAHVDSTSSFQL